VIRLGEQPEIARAMPHQAGWMGVPNRGKRRQSVFDGTQLSRSHELFAVEEEKSSRQRDFSAAGL